MYWGTKPVSDIYRNNYSLVEKFHGTWRSDCEKHGFLTSSGRSLRIERRTIN